MSDYEATVIKTGNSYALRVPKAYAESNNLVIGQKVQLPPPLLSSKKTNHKRLQESLKRLQQLGAYKDIEDPVAWQQEQRSRSPQADREY